jgi:DNA-directed RNA polymerase specialized sigma24 family protein
MLAEATLSGDAAGQAALEELCRRYWPPVRDFLVASRGLRAEDAEDVAQEFFSGLMRSGGWRDADRARGKFRSFLLGGVERTLTDWRRRAGAQKRGGGTVPEVLQDGEERVSVPPEDEAVFDAAWAERVLEVAMDALEQEFEESGRGEEFGLIVPFLSESAGEAAAAEAAQALGLSAGAMKSRVFRFRQRFRDCVLAEVSRTVETPHEAEEEMGYLFRVLSR